MYHYEVNLIINVHVFLKINQNPSKKIYCLKYILMNVLITAEEFIKFSAPKQTCTSMKFLLKTRGLALMRRPDFNFHNDKNLKE